MKEYMVKILGIEKITPNLYKIVTSRPAGYDFIPGQSTFVSINSPSLESKKSAFSFTGLKQADNLEFIIKQCSRKDSITERVSQLKLNDELKIGQAHGNIFYRGMGVFIAAGTGITPFISILRHLKTKRNMAGNLLIYSNKSSKDVIFNNELSEFLGTDFIKLFTGKREEGYYFGRIDKSFLRMSIIDFVRYFYVSGSVEFVIYISSILKELGAEPDSIISERF